MSESNACASYNLASGCDFSIIIHSFIHIPWILIMLQYHMDIKVVNKQTVK